MDEDCIEYQSWNNIKLEVCRDEIRVKISNIDDPELLKIIYKLSLSSKKQLTLIVKH